MTLASPLAAIRAATREVHAQLDGSAFAQAVREGTLPIPRYASYLRAVHTILLAVEESVERSGSEALRDAYAHGCTRRGRLARDLDYLRADLNHVDAAVLHALVLAQQLRRDALRGEAAVLGHLYVLEGSQLGGLLQHRALAQRPELRHGGLAYLAGAAEGTRSEFQAFVAKLEAQLPDEAAVASAIMGATHAFEGFAAIGAAVTSTDLAGPWLTAPLNAEAGAHPIPRDVREVQAALCAGEQSFRSWSYYGARYGERGLRFTRSDSCWLVTVARHDGDAALRQLRWLARVLAARGMPTLLLEQHLELLHASLTTYLPACAHYEALRSSALTLRDERVALLDDAALHRLASSFTGVTASQFDPREAGLLLVAAVLDEKRGIAQAVESLWQWIGDPTRFSSAWVAAAEHTLRTARAAC